MVDRCCNGACKGCDCSNPPREERRVTDAYEAGYEDGKEKNDYNLGSWAK